MMTYRFSRSGKSDDCVGMNRLEFEGFRAEYRNASSRATQLRDASEEISSVSICSGRPVRIDRFATIERDGLRSLVRKVFDDFKGT